ncbi:hypothetical protein D5R93_10645 [Actinomyces lilanjuaniae]|uniref:Uncharacterized protein n=1 Tax=Actinomyces lilanjuaniae TaxID=2321394 RepID=A0ABM6Z5T0_9ACTO|nr:hypothetical protein [Actinomyces lilanjuaniae]AYD90345.1 hypothetical protein D5R93_10645 [Actinomyces lilanjuaniae]
MPSTALLDMDQGALERVGASMQADIDAGRHYGGAVLYVRGSDQHDHLTPAGLTASPQALAAVGGASTGLLYDPDRDLTVIILTAGFIEGLDHMRRLQQLNDLALAAVNG